MDDLILNLETKQASTSERFRHLWSTLTHSQRRYVVALSKTHNRQEAARQIGLQPSTVEAWSHKPIEELLGLIVLDALLSAQEMRRAALTEAMAVKIAGLRSDKEHIRQRAATEIIEWELGKAAGALDLRVTADMQGPTVFLPEVVEEAEEIVEGEVVPEPDDADV